MVGAQQALMAGQGLPPTSGASAGDPRSSAEEAPYFFVVHPWDAKFGDVVKLVLQHYEGQVGRAGCAAAQCLPEMAPPDVKLNTQSRPVGEALPGWQAGGPMRRRGGVHYDRRCGRT